MDGLFFVFCLNTNFYYIFPNLEIFYHRHLKMMTKHVIKAFVLELFQLQENLQNHFLHICAWMPKQEDWLKRLGISMERVMCRLITQEGNDLDKQEIGIYNVV